MKSYLDKLSTLLSQAMKRLSRMPGYTLLSMLGLIISLSGTVIIARYLYQEWTIDHWMPDLKRTYILTREDGDGQYYPTTGQVSPKDEIPRPQQASSHVEVWTDVWLGADLLQVQTSQQEWYSVNTIYVDTMFSEVYPLQAVEGTLQIKAPTDAIISETLARRIFTDESAVGQTLSYNNGRIYRIVGVFRQPRSVSLLRFEMAVNSYAGTDRDICAFAIVRMQKGTRMEDFNSAQKPVEITENYKVLHRLLPYGRTAYEQVLNIFGGVPCISAICPSSHLWMLFVVGILLLFVGVFNFLNLYAVMCHTREHEMRVRRIFGASRWNIFWMLSVENLFITAPAMLGVWMVIELTTPHMKEWFAIEQITMPAFDIGLTIAAILIIPLLASRPTPNPSRQRGEWLRRIIPQAGGLPSLTGGAGGGSFLFLQYFISLTLITVSIYLMRQLHMMMDSDPGYRTEGLLAFSGHLDNMNGMYFNSVEDASAYWKSFNEKKAVMLSQLAESPYIKRIDNNVDFLLFRKDAYMWGSTVEMNGNRVELHATYLSPNQFEMTGLSMKEGRMFCDSLDQGAAHCILNETALRQLGIRDWHTEKVPLYKNLIRGSDEQGEEIIDFDIVGIMKDFHPGRLSDPQLGAFFIYDSNLDFHSPWSSFEHLVEVEPGCEENAIRLIKKASKELTGREEAARRISEDLKNQYRDDRRTARIFTTFSLLAIGVTCLGVLGLMMFDVRRRYREIALRKVHGARFRDIALLLSRRYLIILGLAAAVSIPVSLIGLHQLITRYYTIHTTIAWWIPLASLVIVFLLSALTLWHQIWRATKIEPSIVMKVE